MDRHAGSGRSWQQRSNTLSRPLLGALTRHVARQHEERHLLGLALNDHGLVFPNTVGRPLPLQLPTTEFYPLPARTGLPRIRFHDLRHSAATLLLGLGIHPRSGGRCSAAAQIGITLDLYSHVTATMQQEAVRASEGLFGSQVGQSRRSYRTLELKLTPL